MKNNIIVSNHDGRSAENKWQRVPKSMAAFMSSPVASWVEKESRSLGPTLCERNHVRELVVQLQTAQTFFFKRYSRFCDLWAYKSKLRLIRGLYGYANMRGHKSPAGLRENLNFYLTVRAPPSNSTDDCRATINASTSAFVL
jgi:hypothetical protein